MSYLAKRGPKTLAVGALASALLVGMPTAFVFAAPTPAPSAATKCAPTPGVTDSSVNAALVSPMTGASASSFVGFNDGARLRFAQQNAKGGVNGRKIVTSVYDDKADGATQSSVATKALQQDNAFGFIASSTTDTMMSMLKVQNIPTMLTSGLPATGTDRNVFGVSGPFTATYSSTTQARRMADAGVTKAAVVNHNSPGAQVGGAAFVATAPLEGMTMAIRISDAPIGTYDATSTALRLKNAGAEGVSLVLTPDGWVSVAQAIKQQAVPMKIIMVAGLTDPAVVARAGAALEGAVGSTFGNTPLNVPGKPGIRTFVNGMKAAGLNPNSIAGPLGFIAADTFIKGLQVAGKCPTRASFIDNLRKQTNITGAGLLPAPLSYAPGLTPNGDPSACSWFVSVKNGQLVPDAKATCGKIIETATGKVVKG